MDPTEAHPTTADWYRTFAERDTADVSPVYTDWAHGVAQDVEILRLLDTLPAPRRQPNLVFGAARFLGAAETGYDELRPWLIERWVEVAAVVVRRRTQTNEAGRCAALLPELARLEGPLALIEVGASAGLCLFPDRYSYDYRTPAGVVRLDPPDGPSDVVLPCRLTPADRVPRRLPQVVWRAGIDLNPLDVTSPDDVAWLSALVWPGQRERQARLHAAARVAPVDPPMIVAGDLCTELEQLAAAAPAGASLVVFHTAVLAYVGPTERAAFVAAVTGLDATWISNESPTVVPSAGAALPSSAPIGNRFVLAVDGVPRALTDQHGATYEGLA